MEVYQAKWKNGEQTIRIDRTNNKSVKVQRREILTYGKSKYGVLIGKYVTWDCGYVELFDGQITRRE